jgi:preprotein translocase subunit SecG
MYVFITILIIVICVLLGAVVLIQNPKGGGINASFSGVGQQLLGARRSTDVVEKLTWGLAFALIFLCLATTVFVPKKTGKEKEATQKSELEQYQMNKPFSGQITPPTAPATGTQPKK